MASRTKQERRTITLKRSQRRAERDLKRKRKAATATREQHRGVLMDKLMQATKKGKTHHGAEVQLGVKIKPGGIAAADKVPTEEASPQWKDPAVSSSADPPTQEKP